MRFSPAFFALAALALLMPPTTSVAAADRISSDCVFKGIKLQGKVQIVKSFPDLKIQKVNSFPDLKVQWVNSFPDACGKWQRVESFPDFKIQYVDSFPDLKIERVTAFPGIP